MDRETILNLIGDFTWDFGSQFFIETSEGNFVWSSPEYYGNHVLAPTSLSYLEWIGKGFGRSKGKHSIGNYCGKDVKIL